jgi:FADH2 O2-dependent halogenase
MILHETRTQFDVAILGSGIAGTMLAAILARQGVSVVLIDSSTHPRFVIGESTIPHTSLLFSMLAARYDVPEIDHLAYPNLIADHVAPTSGIKRAFGFAFQRDGQPYNPAEGLLFGTSSKDENHLFRQDIDAYLLHAAIHYGATPRQNAKVTGLEIDPQGVHLHLQGGEALTARYVVDATGHKSFLVDRLGLRDGAPALRHHSRSLFTHMIDVAPFGEEDNPFSLSWHQSTLHHVFERGWIWVIPFNNYDRSVNPLTSVGLTIDYRRYPKNGLSPEQEFKTFLDRFPTVARQFRDARAVRPWVSTDRLQYAARCSTGYRFCLMSHAMGFIDPLFSRGMINTFEVIAALIDPLVAALHDDDFDEARFRPIDALKFRVLDYNDRLVNATYISWSDFDLFNAWIRVWALGTILTEFRLMNALRDYTATGDLRHWHGEVEAPLFTPFEDPDYKAFFHRVYALMEQVEAGTLSPKEAAARILACAGEYPFPVLLREDAMRRAGWLKEGEFIRERDILAARRGYRWAITNPTTRDLFGCVNTFYRWRAQQPDPHLA